MPKRRTKAPQRPLNDHEVNAYEDKLHAQGELLYTDSELSNRWEREYGTKDKQIARHRKARQEIIRDQISDQKHHEQFFDCIENVKAVDPESMTASIEIQKWSKAAELHMKAMNKYLPDVKAMEIKFDDETKAVAEGVSRAAEIIAALAGTRLHRNDERVVSERPVVPPALRDETETHGGLG